MNYADLELHPPEDPEPEPRSGAVLVYVAVALGVLALVAGLVWVLSHAR